MIVLPPTTGQQLTGSVSDLFTDPGLFTLILVVAAIPFFFYVVSAILTLVRGYPGDKIDRELSEKAERSLKELGEKEKVVESELVSIGSALEAHDREMQSRQT